jgi:iron-sulfur cluster repair protein YtfE (RIC family)
MLLACHERVQRSLDLLGRLVEHIDHNGHDASSRSAAQDVLRYFTIAAPQHHLDEELHLFPALLAKGELELVAAVQRLQQDHIAMERLWRQVKTVLEPWATPEATCAPSPSEREAIAAFRAIYPDHIQLENDTVFPAAFALLGTDASTLAGQEMQSRRRVGHNGG